jgi:hypothetical protein
MPMTRPARLFRLVRKATGVDLSTHSRALQEAVWSAAVHIGPIPRLVTKVVQTVEGKGVKPSDPGFDAAFINALYDERGSVRPDGQLVHFHHSPLSTQATLAHRFRVERPVVLDLLASEQR